MPNVFDRRFPRWWPLLFPLTFAIHIVEEYVGGFPAWSASHLGFRLTTAGFLAINEYAWTGMLCASIAATVAAPAEWLVIPLATATAVNGSAHVIMSIVTRTYSPGAISGAALWLPLGIVTLTHSYRGFQRGVFWGGGRARPGDARHRRAVCARGLNHDPLATLFYGTNGHRLAPTGLPGKLKE